MSKLQTAIQKISESSRDGSLPSSREIREAMAAKRNGDRNQITTGETLQVRRSIDIDIASLAEAGIAVAAEDNPALRGEIRRIKWPVLANAFGDQSELIPRSSVVMVASATSGEGKTFTAINLALSIAAERDVEVLLVDADIAKPNVSKLFNVRDEPGLTDFLSNSELKIEDIVLGTSIEGLNLLPAGHANPLASELIASNRMISLVEELDARFPNTIILFDTSPILQTNESQVLSGLVGQVLLVVAANKTPRPAVQEALSVLGDDLVVNVIFNRVRPFLKQKYRYGGYYGYEPERESP